MTNSAPPGERVLVITSSYPRYPGDSAGHFVQTEVEALRRSGHEVTVWAAGAGAWPPTSEPDVHFLGGERLFDHPGVLPRIRRAPWRLWGFWEATTEVFRRRHTRSFDRIIAHWLVPCALPWAQLAAHHDVPLEVVAHGSDVRLLLRLPSGVRNTLLLPLARPNTSLRFVSHEMKTEMSRTPLPQRLWTLVAKARVAPSPIDLGTTPSKELARAELGIAASERWGVIVGRVIPSKRTQVALSAAELVPQMSVAVIGDGPLIAPLQARFPEVRFLGQLPRDETLKWIAAADLLIAPSLEEGAPTAIREARAVGTPVVSVPSGDTELWAKTDPGLWISGQPIRGKSWAKLQGRVRTSS